MDKDGAGGRGEFFMSTGQDSGKPDCARHEREIARLNGEVQALEVELQGLRGEIVLLATKIPGTLSDQLVGMSTQMTNVVRDIADIRSMMRQDLVARNEFNPVQKIVYGMVGLILVTVVGALLTLVLQGRIR